MIPLTKDAPWSGAPRSGAPEAGEPRPGVPEAGVPWSGAPQGARRSGVPRSGVPTRRVALPIRGGEIVLDVPQELSEPSLYKEIATQDISRGRLLAFINKLQRISGSNRELLFCSEQKLRAITREFLNICSRLRRFVADLSTFHSSIAELEEARDDVKAFFYGNISGTIDEITDFQPIVFAAKSGEASFKREELDSFRKILAKGTGMVRTELQKIFAHLFASDPRNLYRAHGPRSQQEILFRQFRRDVEITEMLYTAVRKLDTYMRGAIIPSDLIKMIAEKIETDRSVGCLFDDDYATFLNDLIDEVLEILLPDLQEVLYLDGIWFDDFENIERKAKMLAEACLSFKVFYQERRGLRQAVQEELLAASLNPGGTPEAGRGEVVMAAFDTYRYLEVAEGVRSIDQILIDLEGTLLQWEKGIAKRAFAEEEWGRAVPLERRGQKT